MKYFLFFLISVALHAEENPAQLDADKESVIYVTVWGKQSAEFSSAIRVTLAKRGVKTTLDTQIIYSITVYGLGRKKIEKEIKKIEKDFPAKWKFSPEEKK